MDLVEESAPSREPGWPESALLRQKCTYAPFRLPAEGIIIDQVPGIRKVRKVAKVLNILHFFAFCAFWLPRIGKSFVHVCKMRVGDFRDHLRKHFHFRKNCVCENRILIDVYEGFAKNQKAVLRKIIFVKFLEIFIKIARASFLQ